MKLSHKSSLPAVALCVGDSLRRHRIHAVLVGGACASLYAKGAYSSLDVDYVLSGAVQEQELDAAMGEVGFKRVGGRYEHQAVRFTVEFLAGPLAIGEDFHIRPARQTSGRLQALSLSATDSCRDRLAAFYQWNDRQSLAVAVEIARARTVNLARIRGWSIKGHHLEGYGEFLAELQRPRTTK